VLRPSRARNLLARAFRTVWPTLGL
jgi:hypothetical protein